MKNRLQNSHDEIISYISNWIDTEDWDSLQIIANAASVGCPHAIEHMADYIVGTGAIDSKHCYEHAQSLEQDVELLAKRYRKLTKKQKDLSWQRIFDGVMTCDCQSCNHVSFVNDGNESLYPELLTQCWSCKSDDIVVGKIKASNKRIRTMTNHNKEKAA